MVDLLVVRKGGIQSSVDAALAAQKGAANGIAPLDAASKVPAANSRVESVATRTGAITLGVADVSGAVANTDTRLSNTRTPTDGSVTNVSVAATAAIAKTKLAALDIANADVVAGAAIAETKLALASDAAVGTPSRRTLGTGATQALPGNHSSTTDTRTPTDASVTPAKMSADNKGVIICASTTRPASPVEGQLIYETDTDQVLKNTGTPAAPVWVNTASASAAADETTAGISQQSTAQQIIDGAAGNLFATVARLKAELDRRQTPEAWIAPTFVNGWVNYGTPYATAAYRKDPTGRVHLKGVVKSGTGTGAVFTLPIGYRPLSTLPFVVLADLTTNVGRIEIDSSGNVNRAGGLNTAITLSGISFWAEV